MNAPIRKPTLDELMASRPDPRPALYYPVYGREGTIAFFADYYKAVDFVNAELGRRNLYVGKGRPA